MSEVIDRVAHNFIAGSFKEEQSYILTSDAIHIEVIIRSGFTYIECGTSEDLCKQAMEVCGKALDNINKEFGLSLDTSDMEGPFISDESHEIISRAKTIVYRQDIQPDTLEDLAAFLADNGFERAKHLFEE